MVSGYTINQSKSIVMGFRIPQNEKQHIHNISSANWAKPGVRYLGIRFSKNRKDFVSNNITPYQTDEDPI